MRKVLTMVACLVLLMALLAGCSSDPLPQVTEIAEKYLQATADFDYGTIFELLHEEVMAANLEEAGVDKEGFLEEIELAAEFAAIFMKNIEYEIGDIKEMDEIDLSVLQYQYENDYNLKVKAAYIVGATLSYESMGEPESEEREIIIVKIGSKWYLGDFDL